MIKKIIYTIGFLMFISGPLHPLLGQADSPADANTNTDPKCAFSRTPECRFNANKGLDWGDSFGATDPAKVGQNLYQIIYEKTQVGTQDKAMQATADQYGMQVEKMRLIIGGDITPILERSPMMRIQDASLIYNQMATTYQNKKNSIDLEANIKANIEPNEIFADGDLGNSGFDLINDLNNIEIILFKKADLVTIGGAYTIGTGGNGESTPPAPVPTAASANNSGPGSSGSNSGGTSGGGTSGSAGSESNVPPKSPFDEVPADNKQDVLNGFNPNQCFTDNKAKKALDDFQKDLQTNDKLKSSYVPGSSGSNAGGNGNGNGNNGNGNQNGNSNGNGGTSSPNGSGNNSSPDVPAAKPDNWDPELPCNDIFCLSLQMISEPVTPAFDKSDNCIQCHVQYINDSLQKTIGHSLIPAKATGNLGESSLCKQSSAVALGSVGMNVSVTVSPILTPIKNEMADLSLDMGISRAGKEMVTKTSQEWDLLKCKQDPQGCADKKARDAQNPNDKTPPISVLEREILVAVNTASDTATQNMIWNGAITAAKIQQNNTSNDNLMAAVADQAMGQAKTYQELDKEMKQMNDYFTAFQKLMRTLLEDVPGLASTKACVKLKQKEACS